MKEDIKKIDLWMCEILLYFKYANEEINEGLTEFSKVYIIVVFFTMLFVDVMCIVIMIMILLPQIIEYLPFKLLTCFTFLICLSLFIYCFNRFLKHDNFVKIADDKNIKKKQWGTVMYFIVISLLFMVMSLTAVWLLQ